GRRQALLPREEPARATGEKLGEDAHWSMLLGEGKGQKNLGLRTVSAQGKGVGKALSPCRRAKSPTSWPRVRARRDFGGFSAFGDNTSSLYTAGRKGNKWTFFQEDTKSCQQGMALLRASGTQGTGPLESRVPSPFRARPSAGGACLGWVQDSPNTA